MSKVPAGWEVKSLEELALIERGKFSVRPRNDPRYYGGHIPFVQTGDVTNSGTYLYNFSQTLNDDGLKVSKLFPKETILITIAANIGDTTITTFDTACPDSVVAIQPYKNTSNILWLKLFLETQKDNLDAQSSQNAQKNINLQVLRPLSVLTPPLPEQTKIAQIISTWDKAISTTEQLIGNSQQQKKALMRSLLTGKKRLPGFEGEWVPFAVEKFSTLRKEKFNPKLSEEKNVCIELEHIAQGAGGLNGTSFTNNQMSDKSRFYTGDILFGKLRPYLRKYWFADFSGVCSTEIWVFKNQADKCLPEYLYQLVQTDHFVDGTNISSGTHMPRADWKVVKDIIFKLPPLPEQQKIAQILTAADNEIELLQKKLAFLKQEKTALMQQLLTGKRRVKINATEECMDA